MAPVYHTHTGDSVNGGGCYTAPVTHTHNSSCYTEGSHNSSCPSHTEFHSYDCGSVHDWDGDGHGCDGFVAYDCDGHWELSCGLGNAIIGYSLNCGKSTSTIEYYIPSCGFSDGQIIGAHIVYAQSAARAKAASYVAHSMEEMPEDAEIAEVVVAENAVEVSADEIESSVNTEEEEKSASAETETRDDMGTEESDESKVEDENGAESSSESKVDDMGENEAEDSADNETEKGDGVDSGLEEIAEIEDDSQEIDSEASSCE